MRPLVFNDASFRASPSATHSEIGSWLRDLVAGVQVVVRDRIAIRQVWMRPSAIAVECLQDYTVIDAIRDLRRTGYRDEHSYLLRLTAKAPWLDALPHSTLERFGSCEGRGLPAGDEEPLMLCVVTGGIAISLPSHEVWNTDRVSIRFEELLGDADIQERTEYIDNLSGANHAVVIAERHRAALRSCADAGELWRRRCEVFPHLRFGPGVEANLSQLGGHLPGVAEKLAGLDAAAAEWKDAGGDTPRWRTKVTRESESLRKNPELLDRRRFRSRTGRRELFEWHARYGSGGRIHLRLERESKEIEIGYIGPHLPL